jgi:hypothetical protein
LTGDPIANIKLIEDPAKHFVVITNDGKTYKNTLDPSSECLSITRINSERRSTEEPGSGLHAAQAPSLFCNCEDSGMPTSHVFGSSCNRPACLPPFGDRGRDCGQPR